MDEPVLSCSSVIFNALPSASLSLVAPHIQELVLLPSPVLRLINLIDDSHLNNDEEYEGMAAGRFKARERESFKNLTWQISALLQTSWMT